MPPCPIISSFCLCHSLNNVKYATLNFFRFASLKDGSLIVILVFGNLILVSLAPWAFDNRENSAKKGTLPNSVIWHLLYSSFQLLVPLVTAYRYYGPEVNTRLAHSEAKILHEKIQHKSYSDDEIIRILTTRSKAQLLATFNYYNDSFGHPFNKVHTYLINLCFFLLYKMIQEVTNLLFTICNTYVCFCIALQLNQIMQLWNE